MANQYSRADVVALKREMKLVRRQFGAANRPNIVQWARAHEDSRLYKEFDWNVKSAAEKFWLHQAGQIVQKIKFAYVFTDADGNETRRPVRVYASIVKDGANEYVELDEVLADRVDRASLLDQMRRDVEAVARRYEVHLELAKEVRAVRRLLAAIDAGTEE